ncbi:hypothetical protein MMC07_003754 [Pseudocyphellaria aurata]|nr:hypothetical protein [Pseudocyphellaria aurata]
MPLDDGLPLSKIEVEQQDTDLSILAYAIAVALHYFGCRHHKIFQVLQMFGVQRTLKWIDTVQAEPFVTLLKRPLNQPTSDPHRVAFQRRPTDEVLANFEVNYFESGVPSSMVIEREHDWNPDLHFTKYALIKDETGKQGLVCIMVSPGKVTCDRTD